MDKFKLEKYKPVLGTNTQYGVFDVNDCSHIADMKKDPGGEWVKWGDVKPLLSFMVEKLNNFLDILEADSEHIAKMVREAKEN